MEKSKLWQKDIDVDTKVENFTVGKDRELDMVLAPFDVLGSIAHASMLAEINLLTEAEKEALIKELRNIYKDIRAGNFQIEEHVEDIHSQVELLLTKRLGDIGKKIHSGRSRNDQVLVDLKLWLRHELWNLAQNTQTFFKQLIQLSEQYKNTLLPGYTHLQVAMPSSFGLWFGAYAESLVDDMIVMQSAFKVANKNPLGSAAGYGSSFPLNRTLTTQLLGFDTLNFNVVYAQMGRGKTELVAANALATLAATLGKMAMDSCLYMSQNFGFIAFPDHLTTGSSIMPHKKNPDVFELIRGRCNQLMGLPTQILMITQNLPSGYHRDFQQIKEVIVPAFHVLNECLEMLSLMFDNIKVNSDILEDEKYKYLFSVEEVNKLVLSGIPFREAYRQVGIQIEQGAFNYSKEVQHSHEGSLGNLCNEQIEQLMNKTLDEFNYSQVDQATKALLNEQ
ncbi:argininosuccinate lyase [Rapidithrix thailandica]|uniref:Argininosuccinate lyase n=1 Tax=Rapidithrix thailandica TaxID=413964 RepID=A0AAW9S8J9_9BACT